MHHNIPVKQHYSKHSNCSAPLWYDLSSWKWGKALGWYSLFPARHPHITIMYKWITDFSHFSESVLSIYGHFCLKSLYTIYTLRYTSITEQILKHYWPLNLWQGHSIHSKCHISLISSANCRQHSTKTCYLNYVMADVNLWIMNNHVKY